MINSFKEAGIKREQRGSGEGEGALSLADRPGSRKGPFLLLSSLSSLPPKPPLIFLNSIATVPVRPGYLRFYVSVTVS